MSTGIYVRVSTEEQAREGFSIRAQDEKLRSYASIKDWDVYNVYIDEGISGKNIEDRPAVKQMIADVVSKKVDNVLVYKVDRLTRSTKNLIELVELFNENHCDFNSLMESIDTSTANGRMFLKIVGIFAEFERENLIERTKLGFERKAKEGYSMCNGIVSYGYSREIGNKIQEIDIEESEIVERIFNMYLHDDYSLTKIACTLNAEKIPTKKNRKWGSKNIKLILKNPNYVGKVRYSCNDISNYFEAEGKHKAIINENVFYQVQDKIGKIRKITKTKRPREQVYFCGILYCPICGSKLSSKWNYNRRGNGVKAGYPSYRCINALKNACIASTMSHAKLEVAFEQYISKIEDFTEVENAEMPENKENFNDSERDGIFIEIKRLEKKINEVMELFVSNTIDFRAYQEMIKISNEKRNQLEIRLNLLNQKEENQEVIVSRADILASFKDNWNVLNQEERQQFLHKFIKKIVVHNEKQKDEHYGRVVIDSMEFYEF